MTETIQPRTLDYFNVDKTGWGPGAWQDEPDKRQWTDQATGLPCLIVRGPLGALCGYVGVEPGHSLYEVDYDDVDLPAHGGINFSHFCMSNESDPGVGICHIPEPGKPDHVWWFGFDCAHGSDIAPGMAPGRAGLEYFFRERAVYRDLSYVTRRCAELAAGLKAIG